MNFCKTSCHFYDKDSTILEQFLVNPQNYCGTLNPKTSKLFTVCWTFPGFG